MDLSVFRKIWDSQGDRHPNQNLAEFYHYLCMVDELRKTLPKGEQLRVIEVGARFCTQKPFYEAIGAKWVGIDIQVREPNRPVDPDLVIGCSYDATTIQKAYHQLSGYPHIVFIDANHMYRHVVRDFMSYIHLVPSTGFIALHDVYTLYHKDSQVFLFWEDLTTNWGYRVESIWNYQSPQFNLYGIGLVYMQDCKLSYLTMAKDRGIQVLLPTEQSIAKWKEECGKRAIP